MNKEADHICELIHATAIHVKDGFITKKEGEKKIKDLLDRLDKAMKLK